MNGISDKEAAKRYRVRKNQDYRNQFTKDKYDRITILRDKGDKDKIKALAQSKGLTTTELINRVFNEWLEKNGIDL